MSFLGVTFAGIDETAETARLIDIRSLYFTIEWGVWLAVEHQGQEAGFPGVTWIGELAPELNLSAQLSGKLAQEFLQGDDTRLMEQYGALWPLFRRIQINFISDLNGVDLERLTQLLEKNSSKHIIFRDRGENLDVAEALLTRGFSCSALFDQSEGQEAGQKKWPKGIKKFAGCGYTGGLGPANIYKQLSPILNAAQSAERWWVEMDSYLRTEENGRNVFSLASCKRVIREFDAFFLDYTI